MVRTANQESAISMGDFQSFESRGQKEGSGRRRRVEDRTQPFTKALPWTGWPLAFLLFCSLYYWSTDFRVLSTSRTTQIQQILSTTRIKTTIRHPEAFAQVDLSNLRDPRFSQVGTVSRRTLFHVNHTSSIVLQFGPVDHGIEHCEMKFRLPSFIPSREEEGTSSSSISVYQLDHFTPLLKARMNTKLPARRLDLGMIEVLPGEPLNWNESLNCAPNTILTFEVACSPSGADSDDASRNRCSIEWLQKETAQGFFMVQHST